MSSLRSARTAKPAARFALLTALAMMLLPAPLLRAQAAPQREAPPAPLADHVPADAVLYFGWHGADGLGPQYKGSHLKAVIDATDFKQLGDPFLPQVIARVEKENKQAADAIRAALDVARPMWKHPSAFVFTGMNWTGDKGPTPHLALLCQAGKDAEALQQQLQKSLDEAMKDAPRDLPVQVKVVRHGGLVAVVVGDEKAVLPAGNGGKAATLAADENFKAALGHVGKDPVVVGYVDFDRVGDLINTAVDRFGGPEGKQMWPKVREATGIKDLHRGIWASGFDGKDWVDQAFVAAPEPRKGLLALCDEKPLGDDALKGIPMTATLAGASRFDAARLVSTLVQVVKDVDPNSGEMAEGAIKQVGDALGVNLEDDLLKALGDEWVYYTDPRTGGRGVLGAVFVNHLRDAAKAEKSLGQLEKFANQQLEQALRSQEVKVSFQTTESHGLTIHYLATPFLSPAWAIHEGNLYVALFPQVVAAAADDHARGRDKSILDNKDFTALRDKLGAPGATAVQFMDLPRTAPDAWGQWLMVSRTSGIADLLGVKSPAMLAPPLSRLLPELDAAGSASWVDKDGWHAKAVSPFPGATALSTDPFSGSIGTQSMMISVLLPALNRAREQANRVKSASNLKQIGLGAMMYANEKGGKFPKDLGDLYKTQELTVDVFINPRGTTQRPSISERDKQAEWIEENSDYVWVGGGKTSTAGADAVLAYEKPDGLSEGISVLYGDGHVDFVRMEEAQKLIDAAQTHTERRFEPPATAAPKLPDLPPVAPTPKPEP